MRTLQAERDVRAAAADAVFPVDDAMRTALTEASSGTLPGAKHVAVADSRTAGIADDVAARAQDSGIPVLEDSGDGLVVVATYDTRCRRPRWRNAGPTSPDSRSCRSGSGRPSTTCGPRAAASRSPGPTRRSSPSPDREPSGRASYDVKLQPGPVQEWTLTLWVASPPVPAWAWLLALGIIVAGVGAAKWLVRRDERSIRSQRELVRLQEASATTAALATVAQHSLDLADFLPALTNELAAALGLQGLSLAAPSAQASASSSRGATRRQPSLPLSMLPAALPAGETLCLVLGRGGRTVARLRVVAGRDLDGHDLNALGAAAEVLTSALVNAETFAQQRDLLDRMRSVDELKTVFLATASHELRTPVSAITGYAQILATSWDTLSPEEARLYAEQVDSNAQRLGALVEDLLDFSRLERGAGVVSDESVLDLGEVVTRILDEQPDLAPDHQVVHQTVPGIAVAGSLQAVERVAVQSRGQRGEVLPRRHGDPRPRQRAPRPRRARRRGPGTRRPQGRA